jgi:hypothetical protein
MGMDEAAVTREPVKVGVLLPPVPDDPGEWLADAAAFDVAGADALWIDAAGAGSWIDPFAVAAALSAVTFRALLVLTLPADPDGPAASAAPARTLATIGRLSRGRLALCGDQAQLDEAAEAGGGPPALDVFCRLDDELFMHAGRGGDQRRWVRTGAPEGRAAWRAAVGEAAERGVAGVVVPAGPRLLDILRNPDGEIDRRDLQLATG